MVHICDSHAFFSFSEILHIQPFVINILYFEGFPDSSMVKNLPANPGDMGSNPSLERSHLPRSNTACVL